MNKVFGIIHVILIGYVVLTGNTIYDHILGGIIAVLGYIYSFRLVGGIASMLDYNSGVMSFMHWTIRTVVVFIIVIFTRNVYKYLNLFIGKIFDKNSELISVIICSLSLIIVAEVLKKITGLNKSYW